jgi:hypothetical protein
MSKEVARCPVPDQSQHEHELGPEHGRGRDKTHDARVVVPDRPPALTDGAAAALLTLIVRSVEPRPVLEGSAEVDVQRSHDQPQPNHH